MNKILSTVFAIATMGVMQPVALAQEYPGCFAVDSNGNPIDLSSLCPEAPTVGNGENTSLGGPAAGVFQIPIERRQGGIPVVQVVFNGTERFEMLFDTGASATLITPTMARKLNVVPFETALIATASASDVEVGVGRVNSLQVGEAILEQVIVTIASPEAEVGLQGMGLLGQNFFGNYDITIKENAIELRSRG